MADDLLQQAVQWGGTAGIGALLGAFAKGLLTGGPTQDRELRNDMSADIKEMRAAMSVLRQEMDEQRKEHAAEIDAIQHKVDLLTRRYLHALETRSEARTMLREAHVRLGIEVKVWDADPTFT